jgi:hypothetical protein
MVKVTERQIEIWCKMIDDGYTYKEIEWLTCEYSSLIQYHVAKKKEED